LNDEFLMLNYELRSNHQYAKTFNIKHPKFNIRTTVNFLTFARQNSKPVMKKLLLILVPALIIIGCWGCGNSKSGPDSSIVNVPASASGQTNGKLPTMVFSDTNHDFGVIEQGEKVSYTFKFKNAGNADLVISSAVGSCGCTIPHYPKGTVSVGDTGTVDVTFDSSGKQGKVIKTVTIVTNCQPNTKIITITADIQLPKYQ